MAECTSRGLLTKLERTGDCISQQVDYFISNEGQVETQLTTGRFGHSIGGTDGTQYWYRLKFILFFYFF
jgi:hypothetical protein